MGRHLFSFSCLNIGAWIMLENDILLTQALLFPPLLFHYPVGALARTGFQFLKPPWGSVQLPHPGTLRKAIDKNGKKHSVPPHGMLRMSWGTDTKTGPEHQVPRPALPLGSGASSAQYLAQVATRSDYRKESERDPDRWLHSHLLPSESGQCHLQLDLLESRLLGNAWEAFWKTYFKIFKIKESLTSFDLLLKFWESNDPAQLIFASP